MTNNFKIESPHGRPAVIAVVMFVILLLSVGGVYWLITVKTTLPRGRGEEIIKTLRSKNLSEQMDTQFMQAVFIARNHEGKIIGERTEFRWFRDGRFLSETEETRLTNEGRNDVESTCGLADDLSECYYQGRTNQLRTEIILKDGKSSVTSHQKIHGMWKPLSGTADIPANYIPDGAMLPVLRLVAKSGESAGFCMAVDDSIFIGNNVQFTDLTIEPLDKNTIRTRSSMLGGLTQIYHLDSDGEIKQIDLPDHGITFTRVSITRVQPEQIPVSAAFMEMLQKMGWQ